MATSLKNRRKKGGEPSMQDLVLAITKATGLDMTQEYDPDTFSSMWVGLYQSEDPDSYAVQGEYLYNLFVQLQSLLAQNTMAIVPTERKTKVWYQHSLALQDKTDSEIIDDFTNGYPVYVKPVVDEQGATAFLAIEVDVDV
jgi:hypothetical protein